MALKELENAWLVEVNKGTSKAAAIKNLVSHSEE